MAKQKKKLGSTASRQNRRNVFAKVRRGVIGLVQAPDNLAEQMKNADPKNRLPRSPYLAPASELAVPFD
jgi:hypothetical protein